MDEISTIEVDGDVLTYVPGFGWVMSNKKVNR